MASEPLMIDGRGKTHPVVQINLQHYACRMTTLRCLTNARLTTRSPQPCAVRAGRVVAWARVRLWRKVGPLKKCYRKGRPERLQIVVPPTRLRLHGAACGRMARCSHRRATYRHMTYPSAIGGVLAQVPGVVAALAIGLLIGVERERSKGQGPDRAPAGIRTFSIVGLVGALAALIGPAGIYVSGAFLSLAMAVSYRRTRQRDPGLTTEIAMLLTFLLGVFAHTSPAMAGAIGVVVAILLASKHKLHHISRRWLTAAELQDLLILLAAAFVVLPLLPDVPVDPWEAINPRRLWLLVVAMMSISTLGYLALRILGTRFGLAIAGVAGGFVSSTATVLAMAERARADKAHAAPAASAAIMSNVGTVVQFAVVVGALSATLLEKIALALLAAGVASVVTGVLASWQSFLKPVGDGLVLEKHPFNPLAVLKLVALLATVMFVLAILRAQLGNASLPWMTALSALADVHAAAAAVAQAVASGQVDVPHAVPCVVIAMATNGVWKCLIAFWRSRRAYALRVGVSLTIVNAIFAVTALAGV